MTKACSDCGDEKPIDCFNRARKARDGRKGQCRACEKKKQPTRVIDRLKHMKE